MNSPAATSGPGGKDESEAERIRAGLAQAVKLMARREHSRTELANKLQQRGYSQGETDVVLDECVQQGWLDDLRYAEMYVRQRQEALYGPVRIAAELQQRGISHEPEALKAVPEETWRHQAVCLRAKKFGLAGALDWKERGRQGRFLAQRGYTMGQIEHALEAAVEQE